jgi:hypothetical protein
MASIRSGRGFGERFAPQIFRKVPTILNRKNLQGTLRLQKVLSAIAINSTVSDGTLVSSFKHRIERIKALETERRNLLLEIEELKRMADAKAKALESEVNMLRDEVKSLRILLSGEDLEADSRTKKKK